MAVEVILPKVDMDMETGKISRWYVKEGDKVEKGQLLFEIETDKAAMEVDSPATGIIGSVSTTENISVPVGHIVAWIYNENEKHKGVSQSPSSIPKIDDALENIQDNNSNTPDTIETVTLNCNNTIIRATPLARRLAREFSLDLKQIEGTGPKNRIQKRDVVLYHSQNMAEKMPFRALVRDTSIGEYKHQVTQGDGPLHAAWLRQGKGDNIPVVLIHGFASSLNSWRGFLSGSHIDNPILAIDLPGHGQSSKIIPHDLDEIAGLVEETLKIHNIKSCVLVGHSFGGAVAATIAARMIIEISSLMLISSAGLGPDINGAYINGICRAKSSSSASPWLYKLVHDRSLITKTFVNATLAQLHDEELQQIQIAIGEQFFADSTQTFEVRSLVNELKIPVKLIFGNSDEIIPVSHSRGLSGSIGVHVFLNCGHLPHIEKREAVFNLLEQSIRSI